MSVKVRRLRLIPTQALRQAISEAGLEVNREQCDAGQNRRGEAFAPRKDGSPPNIHSGTPLLEEATATPEGYAFTQPYAQYVDAAFEFAGVAPQNRPEVLRRALAKVEGAPFTLQVEG